MIIEALAFFLLILSALFDIRRQRITRAGLIAAGLLSLAAVLTDIVGAGGGIEELAQVAAETALAMAPGAFLIALAFLSRESIGYGDGLCALLIGPVFGFARMAAGICLAFFISALLSVLLLVMKRVNRKSCLPFLPFLATAMGVMRVAIR